MRVLFVASHGCGDNDDEGAIAYALQKLGHEVICVHEKRRHRRENLASIKADFCLFLKWPEVHEIRQLRMPRFLWFFDIVATDNASLALRAQHRREWFNAVLPHCEAAFVTDGNFAEEDPKLYHLMQGFDERMLNVEPVDLPGGPPVIFTGMIKHGTSRAQHIAELSRALGDKFTVVGDCGPRGRMHGADLAGLLENRIAIAPDGPQSDKYWSNRVYLTLGYKGFLLHPYCAGLAEQFEEGKELRFYRTRNQLLEQVHHFLQFPEQRIPYIIHGFSAICRRHLYRHRVEQMLRIVEAKL